MKQNSDVHCGLLLNYFSDFSFLFGLLLGQKKHFEDIIFGSAKLKRSIFLPFVLNFDNIIALRNWLLAVLHVGVRNTQKLSSSH